ncbi:MAG: TIGR02757 family protein [Synergistaceae bacterium]|nr:TIGR02757 family protein [Synergistaceae bacterium]
MNNLNEQQIKLKAFLDGLYYAYSRRELIQPDPLYFLYCYDRENLEVVGLIAASLAYGRVAQILKSVEAVLTSLGEQPRKFLLENYKDLKGLLKNFKHRFTTSGDMENLLINIAKILKQYESLENFLGECLGKADNNLLNALDIFADELSFNNNYDADLLSRFPLVTAPRDGSACKRLFLFLKWMVRSDDVDPGGWKIIKTKDLIMPTDTHIHNISRRLGLSKRRQADLKTAVEITRSLAELNPEDPTKYDFVLTRFGIRDGLSMDELSELAGIKNPA